MRHAFLVATALTGFAAPALAADEIVTVPVGRTMLVQTPASGAQTMIDNPDVARISEAKPNAIIIEGERLGRTDMRVFDRSRGLVQQVEIVVGYDLPEMRKALKTALPQETISIDMANANLVLSGSVSSADAANKAIAIVSDSIKKTPQQPQMPQIVNAMQTAASSQVVLHVRIGEIDRDALKSLAGILGGSQGKPPAVSDLLAALEKKGQFTSLVEPNLSTAPGQETGFTAGGPIALPGGAQNASFDITVKFNPTILPDNRVRLSMQPDVSELGQNNGVPALATHHSQSEVTLASGESFVLAGLMRDDTRSIIAKLPGATEMPVLGRLFKDPRFVSGQSDLVITVTPYVTNPLASSGAPPPTPVVSQAASPMGTSFIGSVSPGKPMQSEGPAGFMTD